MMGAGIKGRLPPLLLIFFAGSLSVPGAFAQNTPSNQSAGFISPREWVLLPREAYVGDRVELRLTIAPGIELLPQSEDFVSKEFRPDEVWGSRDLAFRQKLLAQDEGAAVSVHGVSLQRTDGGYSLSLVLTPWLPREIEPGYLNVLSLPEVRDFVGGRISGGTEASRQVPFLLVQLPKMQITSLSSKMGVTQLRPVAPPVLVPGSIYVVYGLGIAVLLLLIGVAVVLARFQQVRLFLKGVAVRIRLSRNYRWALRQLRRLDGESLGGKELAARLECIARTYLEGRFGRSFTSAATSEIMFLLDEIFVGMLSDRQLEVAEGICVLLRRCDYLRYAPDARLERGEKDDLIRRLCGYVGFMEGKQ